jgi:hypothetical protein
MKRLWLRFRLWLLDRRYETVIADLYDGDMSDRDGLRILRVIEGKRRALARALGDRP